MPSTCEYCQETFTTKSGLDVHMKTVAYCLRIQQSKGVQVSPPEYKCECGYECTRKNNFKRHRATCSIIKQTSSAIVTGDYNTIYNGPVTNVQNNIQNNTINVSVNYSISNLTPDYIMSVLQPVLTEKVLKGGMPAITNLIIDLLLQRDGKYIYFCTDVSRDKFTMLIDHEGKLVEKADPLAVVIRRILYSPLTTLSAHVAQNSDDKDVHETIQELKDLKADGNRFKREMRSKLPADAEGMPAELTHLLAATEKFEKEAEQRLAEMDAKRLADQRKSEQERTDAAYNAMLDNCQRRGSDGLYWNRLKGWLIELIGAEPVIVGYASDINAKAVTLTKVQIERIKSDGLWDYLHESFRI